MESYPFGAVLKIQREQSLPSIRARLDRMKSIDMNTAVVWPAVYWWEEKTGPRYPYETGHQILAYAEKLGMRIIMELAGQITCLEYAPDFLMKDEYYALRHDGSKIAEGMAYDYLNYNHPAVKQLVTKQFAEIAANYRGYRSLYGYDIWNETAFTSFDEHTLEAFRRWLKRKYATLQRLNDAWDREYREWSQVRFTTWMWASVMPKVDYEQFHKDNIGTILNEWRSAIRSVDPTHPTIADNVHSMITMDPSYDCPHDDWAVSQNVDEFGISFYPKNDILGSPAMEHPMRWETLVGASSASRDGRFWVLELQTHHQAMFNPHTAVHPHELRWWTWEAMSHGARGVIYWKWDPFTKGVQTFGRGLVDARGDYTPRAHEAAAIRKVISNYEREFTEYRPEQPHAAILYDRLNHDFIKAYTLYFEPVISSALYTDSIAGLFEGLWTLNIAAGFVVPDGLGSGALEACRVLFVTNQVYISERIAECLKRFVRNGGTVVFDGKLAEVDESGILFENAPGGLRDAMGIDLLDMEPADHTITVRWGQHGVLDLPAHHERRNLVVSGAEVDVTAAYGDGAPAVVRCRYGKGCFVYVSTFLWRGFRVTRDPRVLEFVRLLDQEYGLHLHRTDDNAVKLRSLKGEGGYLLFAFNYGAVDVDTLVRLGGARGLAYTGKELRTGAPCILEPSGDEWVLRVHVQSRDVSIVKIEQTA